MKLSFEYNSQPVSMDLVPGGSGRSYRAVINDRTVDIEILKSEEGRLELLLDGRRVTARVSADQARRWVTIDGQTFVLTKASGARRGGHGHAYAAGELLAPMPGQIRAVNVNEGDPVTRGQTLLVLEAMKMEIRVQAPADGVVKKLFVDQGQTVEREQILIEIEEN